MKEITIKFSGTFTAEIDEEEIAEKGMDKVAREIFETMNLWDADLVFDGIK